MASNKQHECRYCDKSFSKKCIGKHIIQQHSEELKEHFAPFRTTAGIAFPYTGRHGYTVCLCCGGYWAKSSDGKGCIGHVRNHLNKSTGCTEAGMLSAIYLLLDCEPPAGMVVKSTATHYENRLKDKDDCLKSLIRSNEKEKDKSQAVQNDFTQLQNQHSSALQKIKALERQLDSERKTRQLWELKHRALETQRSAEKSLADEKIRSFVWLCQEKEIDEWRINEITEMTQDSTTELQLKVVDHQMEQYKDQRSWFVSETAAEPPLPPTLPQPPKHTGCSHCSAPADSENLYVCKCCKKTGHIQFEGMHEGCVIECYMYECKQCGTGVCRDCCRKNGGGKSFPEYCSQECRIAREKSKQ